MSDGVREETPGSLKWAFALVVLVGCTEVPPVATAEASSDDSEVGWPHYGNDPGGTKYSALDQVNRDNVSSLEVAWTVRTHDFDGFAGEHAESPELPAEARDAGACGQCHGENIKFETTPLLRDGALLVSTPLNRVLALDPETGAERWAYDPAIDPTANYSEGLISRGVSAWSDPADPSSCGRRVYVSTVDARLLSLSADNGLPCEDFGVAGTVDLTRGVAINGREVDGGDYLSTSPPAVIGDLVIVGSAIGDNRRRDVESGVVRAYDARSGALRWSFDPIPRGPDHPAAPGWSDEAMRVTGAANVWSIISTDPERGLVFLPTGSAAPDFYGGDRPGRNDFANSVVALHAGTGDVVWSFQVVHHDLWDYDVASQPVLIDLVRSADTIPAVVVGTKMGHIFVLDRETGEPLFPVEERPVPQNNVAGEQSWPTQPFPTLPPPLHSTQISADDAWGITDEDREFCRAWMSQLENEGIFTPPSLTGIMMWPGFAGGMNWGGLGWDPERQILVTTVKRLAMYLQLHTRADFESAPRVEGREYTRQEGTPYGMSRQPLVSPSGLPCNPPPFGKLVAVDLSDGTIRWERPLGQIPELAGVPGSEEWGSMVFGGPLVTGGGLTFIGAGQDDRIRAFDTESGDLLWEHELPAGAQAAPMTYRIRGEQYVVIVAGGRAGIGTSGDYVVAFRLPESP